MIQEQINKNGEINLRIFLLARIHCSIEEESVNCFLDQNSLVGIMTLRFSRQLATQSLKGKSGFVADGSVTIRRLILQVDCYLEAYRARLKGGPQVV